jgi:hypothetical protein
VSHVFISYAREDREIAAELAEVLERKGWSVFWDPRIPPGKSFDEVIEAELRAASCVVVLWSRKSVRSDWVKTEASEGRKRRILLPARIEEVEPPLEFGRIQAADLVAWRGGGPDRGLDDLIQAITEMVPAPDPPEPPAAEPATTAGRRRPRAARGEEEPVRSPGGPGPPMREHFETALLNIDRFGDTDVLPFPIEKQIFFDKQPEVLELLLEIHADFDDILNRYPAYNERSLSAVGFYGYRWVTHIDSIWNAYLLGLVVALGDSIEEKRLEIKDNSVFSYRFRPNRETGMLFDPNVGWRQYQQQALEHAESHEHVLTCDISDFYPRVDHRRLGRALEGISKRAEDREHARRILLLLAKLARGAGYGLPVGGPAARLLSELLLHSVDYLLTIKGIVFCRFTDDYHVFADTEEEAYRHLMTLSENLFEVQGLMLQKNKTRIMPKAEFRSTSAFAEGGKAQTPEEEAKWGLLNLKIHFDPYSESAEEDYEALRKELNRHNILNMLARELNKSRVDSALTRQLVRAVKFLDDTNRDRAVRSLLESLPKLYPLMPHVLQLIKTTVGELSEGTRDHVFAKLRQLIQEGSYLVNPPCHLAYAVRVLAHDPSDATDKVLDGVFAGPSRMVRRDVILAMARRRKTFWVEALQPRLDDLGQWERRALLIASHISATGRSWRDSVRAGLSPMDLVASDWVGEKGKERDWEIPI